MLELYFAPGACSFVPHAGLEIVKARTGKDFVPKLVKLHKGEQNAPEYLALNPNGQVPTLVVDGQPITQIVAICDVIDRLHPDAGLLPTETMARAQAMSRLAWMNNTVHPTFTHVFRPATFCETEAAQKEVRAFNAARFRKLLERIEASLETDASPFFHGAEPGLCDAYAFTFLRWGGYAGIDPASLPTLHAYVLRVIEAAPVAAALARERIGLDTYKPAAA